MNRALISALVCLASAAGQSNLNLLTGPPAQVAGAGGTWTGAPGNAPIYYFVVLRSRAGRYAAFAPNFFHAAHAPPNPSGQLP